MPWNCTAVKRPALLRSEQCPPWATTKNLRFSASGSQWALPSGHPPALRCFASGGQRALPSGHPPALRCFTSGGQRALRPLTGGLRVTASPFFHAQIQHRAKIPHPPPGEPRSHRVGPGLDGGGKLPSRSAGSAPGQGLAMVFPEKPPARKAGHPLPCLPVR